MNEGNCMCHKYIEGLCEVQVVPITSTDIKERIHQTYRMGYIKDVILPRVS